MKARALAEPLWRGYDALVLGRPRLTLALLVLALGIASLRFGELYIDTSSESLSLENDQAVRFFQEVQSRYPSSGDQLYVSYRPHTGDLLVSASLDDLAALAAELRSLPGVESVLSLLDVPLLFSPQRSVGDLATGRLYKLRDAATDQRLARIELLESPLYGGLLSNRQLSIAMVLVTLQDDAQLAALDTERRQLRQAPAGGTARARQLDNDHRQHQREADQRRARQVAAVRATLERHRTTGEIFLGGVPMITADMVSFVKSDLRVFGGAIAVLILALLGLIFRHPFWVLLPAMSCAATVLSAVGLFAWIGWSMSVVSANFIALLLILTLSLSMHLLVRYRELLVRLPDLPRTERVRQLVRFMSRPCLCMALTTMASFCSLAFSNVRPVIDFGWMMATGTALAFLWAFLLLPALLVLWPAPPTPASAADPGATGTRHFATAVERHGRLIAVVCLLSLAFGLSGLPRINVESRFIDYFKSHTEIHRGMALIDRELGGTVPLEIVLQLPKAPPSARRAPQPAHDADDFAGFGDGDPAHDADNFADFGDDDDGGAASGGTEDSATSWFSGVGLARLERVHDMLDAYPETGKVLSLATTFKLGRQVLGHTPSALEIPVLRNALPGDISELLVRPYLSADEQETRIVTRVLEARRGELQRDEFLRRVAFDLRDKHGLGAEQAQLSGLLVLYNNLLQSLYQSQLLTLGTVLATILAMFLVLFRSLTLSLLALAPNLLATILVLGGMGWFGLPLDLMNVTMAAIVLGIGVDNTIHYIWRFRVEFPRDHDYGAAIQRSHGSIGRAMYYTSVTVIIGFSILGLSNFLPSVWFGMLTALAILIALLGALLLLPLLLRSLRPLGADASQQ